VVSSNSRENCSLQSPDHDQGRAAIEGWITLAQAKRIFAAGGFDFEALKRKAATKEFRPMPLGAKASFSLRNQMRPVVSHNVVARLEGSNRKQRDEWVIYSAHWDHLGRNPKLQGDPVYHGAVDNASGVAGLLALARAYTHLPAPPRRSILFLALTAEEKGLLGSSYYVQHPLYPLNQTLADLNMDGLNVWGRTADVQIIGSGNSSLEELLAAAASVQGRSIIPEVHPEKGFFFRSDQFEFAKAGVPALFFGSGTNYLGKAADFGLKKRQEYIANDYHKVTDTIKPDWNLSGAIEDLRLMFEVGWDTAEAAKWPVWNQGSPYRATREQMLQKPRASR
jgi:Zn-dependent M28 family amino/carboxypeptidase